MPSYGLADYDVKLWDESGLFFSSLFHSKAAVVFVLLHSCRSGLVTTQQAHCVRLWRHFVVLGLK